MSKSTETFDVSQKTADAINRHFDMGTGVHRLLTIRSGLVMEIRIPGMRLTAKAPKCSTILRREFGLSGKPIKLLAIFENILTMVEVIKPEHHSTIVELGERRLITDEERASGNIAWS